MYDYVTTHHLRHQELIEAAEQRRLVAGLRQANTSPNPVASKLGEMLVGVGERLLRNGNRQRQLVSEPTSNLVNPNSIIERTQS